MGSICGIAACSSIDAVVRLPVFSHASRPSSSASIRVFAAAPSRTGRITPLRCSSAALPAAATVSFAPASRAIAVSSVATCPRATHLMHFEPISAAKTVLNIFERPPKQFLLGTGNAFSLCTPCPYKKLFPFLQRITRSDSKIFGFFGFLRQSKVFRTAELPHTAETFLTYSIRYVRKNRVVISLFF